MRNRNFRLLWIGEAISTFGSFFTRLAVPFFVFELTQSYWHLGLSRFLPLVAALLFGLLAGALVDRWDRRRAMIGTDLASGMLLMILFVVMGQTLETTVKLAALYAISFFAQILRTIATAARVALIPDIVSKDELLAANALDQSTTQLAELLSYPVIAVALMVGPVVSFGVDALTFFVSAVFAFLVIAPRTVSTGTQNNTIWADIAAGITITRRLPLVRHILVLSLVVPAIFSLMFTLQLPYAVDVARSNQAIGFTALEGSMALGFMIGAWALGRWGQKTARSSLLGYGLAGMGIGLTLQGVLPFLVPRLGLPASVASFEAVTPLLLLALPTVVFSGMTNSLVNTGIRTVVQEQTPQVSLGRVFSVIHVAASVSFAIGALLTTFAAGRVPLVLMICGILLLLIGLVSRAWLANAETKRPRTATEVKVRV